MVIAGHSRFASLAFLSSLKPTSLECRSLFSGSRLGSNELLSLFGKGGMVEVYRAKDLKLVLAASTSRRSRRIYGSKGA